MATDILMLGGFIFTDWEVPESMPFGGKQQVNAHKMPGGYRVVDAMGPDDDDRTWKGIMWGDTAFDDMLTLDAMRVQGQELPFSWAAESRTAIITSFKADAKRFPQYIEYEITIMFTDDSGTGSGGGFGFLSSITSLVTSDLAAAIQL